MKTEPTETLSIKRANIVDKYLPPIDEQRYYQRLEMHEELIDLISSHSPKIKQLEWLEVNDCGEIGIEAKTPFCNYEVYEYEISNCSGFVLWWYEPYPYVFDTEIQAKMFAQDDFEKRVKECLDYE